ncbi:MAG: hypothetical protein V1738_06205 [Patescibacteria group bacterium]
MESQRRHMGGRNWVVDFTRLVGLTGRVLFPHFCLSCGAEGELLCGQCETKYALQRGILFSCNSLAGIDNRRAETVQSAKTPYVGDIRCFSAGRYADPVLRTLLHLYKYERVSEAGEILARIFVHSASRQIGAILAGSSEPVVVPLPMNQFNQAFRGFNQSESFARIFAGDFELEIDKNLLKKRFSLRTQAHLSGVQQRMRNVQNSFIVRADRQLPEEIILVDDVFTTGATIRSCVTALRQAGVAKIFVATVLKS